MEKTITKRKHRKYDEKFQEEAIRMAQNGRSVPEVARTLGIGENLFTSSHWVHPTFPPTASS